MKTGTARIWVWLAACAVTALVMIAVAERLMKGAGGKQPGQAAAVTQGPGEFRQAEESLAPAADYEIDAKTGEKQFLR